MNHDKQRATSSTRSNQRNKWIGIIHAVCETSTAVEYYKCNASIEASFIHVSVMKVISRLLVTNLTFNE